MRKVVVCPIGATGPIEIDLDDPNEDERVRYWEEQLSRRETLGDWDPAMEDDDLPDEFEAQLTLAEAARVEDEDTESENSSMTVASRSHY